MALMTKNPVVLCYCYFLLLELTGCSKDKVVLARADIHYADKTTSLARGLAFKKTSANVKSNHRKGNIMSRKGKAASGNRNRSKGKGGNRECSPKHPILLYDSFGCSGNLAGSLSVPQQGGKTESTKLVSQSCETDALPSSLKFTGPLAAGVTVEVSDQRKRKQFCEGAYTSILLARDLGSGEELCINSFEQSVTTTDFKTAHISDPNDGTGALDGEAIRFVVTNANEDFVPPCLETLGASYLTSNLQVISDVLDPRILTAIQDGYTIDFLGAKDANGVSLSLDSFIVETPNGVGVFVTLDGQGRPISLISLDGSSLAFEWSSDTKFQATVTNSSASISESLHLDLDDLVDDRLLQSRARINDKQSDQSNVKDIYEQTKDVAQSDNVGLRRLQQPNPAEPLTSSIRLVDKCGDPVTDASVWFKVFYDPGFVCKDDDDISRFLQGQHQGGGRYTATFDDTIQFAPNPSFAEEKCENARRNLGGICNVNTANTAARLIYRENVIANLCRSFRNVIVIGSCLGLAIGVSISCGIRLACNLADIRPVYETAFVCEVDPHLKNPAADVLSFGGGVATLDIEPVGGCAVPRPGRRWGHLSGVFGDPHLSTFDRLRFDCQAQGEFIMLKSLDSIFQIQERFTSVGSGPCSQASVSTGISIGEEGLPVIQLSIPRGGSTTAETVAGCPVDLYVDRSLRLLSEGSGHNNIEISNQGSFILVFYPLTGLEARLRIRRSSSFGCFFTVQYLLPFGYRSNERMFGLLGKPNGIASDDWVDASGNSISPPSSQVDRVFSRSYQYCTENWCIKDENQSLFAYGSGESFDDFFGCDASYNAAIELAVENASDELEGICGSDLICLVDGICGSLADAQNALMDETFVTNAQDMGRFEEILPTARPTNSQAPSVTPSTRPSVMPSQAPSTEPSKSKIPSQVPSIQPSHNPSMEPSVIPSASPSMSAMPSHYPSLKPSANPSADPTAGKGRGKQVGGRNQSNKRSHNMFVRSQNGKKGGKK